MRLEDPHRPLRRRRRLPVPALRRAHAARARGHRRVVRLGRDAVRPVARAVRERGPLRARASRRTSSARRSTRRAGGSTRCWRSASLLFDRAPYESVVCLGPDPRRRRPEDVEVQGQHRRALGRASTASAPTRSAGTSSPPSSRGTATASRRHHRRGRPPLPAPAVEHLRVPHAPTSPRHERRADRARPLDPVAAERDGRRGHRAPRRVRRDDRRPGDRRLRRRPLQLVRARARGGASGRATARPSPRCATCAA